MIQKIAQIEIENEVIKYLERDKYVNLNILGCLL